MSLLKKAIKEMRSYGEMGLPAGETSMGMGDSSCGSGGKDSKVVSAYRMNDIMRTRNAAEEEESFDDEVDMDMDAGEPSDDLEAEDPVGGVEEIKQFFVDNPSPSDEEVAAYAEERGIDMQQMRQEVYDLIQSLLGTDDEEMDGMDDMDDMGDMDELPDEEMSADTDEEDCEIAFNTRI